MISREENVSINGVDIVRATIGKIDSEGNFHSVSLYDAADKLWSATNYFTPETWPFTEVSDGEVAYFQKLQPLSDWNKTKLLKWLLAGGIDLPDATLKDPVFAEAERHWTEDLGMAIEIKA